MNGWRRCCLLWGWALWALTMANGARADEAQPAQLVALDTAETVAELSQLARALGAADTEQRSRAYATLRTLGGSALPAITKRLEAIAQRGYDAEATVKAFTDLRRVQGIDSADAELDLAQGVLPLLRKDRSRAALLASELVALLRALEAQRSLEAAELIVGKLWPLDAKLFRYEAPRTRARLGVLMIPAFLRYRTHARAHVRALCEEGLGLLSITSPGRAVQQDDVGLLAAILRAYGDTLTFEAMPVVVSYLSDERLEVQKAALHALARFGKNAIWQLRERYLNATGKDADPSWRHQRLRDELLRLFEAPKLAEFSRAMARAELALAGGDLGAAQAAANDALRAQPTSSQATRALPVYDALARAFEARGALGPALSATLRALRLSAEDALAGERKARALWLEAELRLSAGQVDLKAYERALALDPGLSEAQARLDELTGKSRERAKQERRLLAGLAALLMLLAGVFVLRDKPSTRAVAGDSCPEASAADERA